MFPNPFWQSWTAVNQRIGLVVGAFFVFSLLFLGYSYWEFPAPALSWQYVEELDQEEIPVHTFEQGLLSLTVHGDNYLLFEHLTGAPLRLNATASYILLGALVLFIVIWLSVVAALKRFWFCIGMGLFILLVVSFRMETLQMFGSGDKVFTALTLFLYSSASTYFQFFNTRITFSKRLFSFLCITAVPGLLIVFFAAVERPLLHLTVQGISGGIFIGIIFIFTVAHEIVASFLFLATRTSRQGKNVYHFLIISTVYIANLAFIYAHRIGMMDWDFTSINLFFLLSISGVLGIWGFRQRAPQYNSILEADPFGVYIILSMGIVCFTLIGYFLGTANDAPLVAINDAIIYTHLGYGVLFTAYVFSNFFGPLIRNMPVYKVLYQPHHMPYFTFQLAGFITTLALVFYNTWQTPVHNLRAGGYNAEGDLYYALDDTQTAEAFYNQASLYGFLNHHANYAIAHIKGQRQEDGEEKIFYDRASRLRPSEFSYLNLSHTLERRQEWLDALLVLKQARKSFPESGPIANAMGILYLKIGLVDSSLFAFRSALDADLTQQAARINFVGTFAKSNSSIPVDSLFMLIRPSPLHEGTESNALALANIQGAIAPNITVDLSVPSTLNLFSASRINNYMINHLSELDSTFIYTVIQLSRLPVNAFFFEPLLFTSALALYETGRIGKAFSLLEEIAASSYQQGRYNNILALWSMEQEDPERAVEFLRYSRIQQYSHAGVTYAVALSESGRIEDALESWNSLKKQDSGYRVTAEKMIRILTVPPGQVAQLTDEERYAYCRYRLNPSDGIGLNRVWASMQNADLKAQSIFEVSKKLFDLDDTQGSMKMLRQIDGLQLSDTRLYERILLLELALLAKTNDLTSLAQRMNDSRIRFSTKWKDEEMYFNALLNEAKGEDVQAETQYRWLAYNNPYREEAVIAAAHYFRKPDQSNLRAYTILTDALYFNPRSIKLLKAYILEAARLGFDEYAIDALQDLRSLITDSAWKKFLSDNKEAIMFKLPSELL